MRGQDQGVIAAQMAKPICFKVLKILMFCLFQKIVNIFLIFTGKEIDTVNILILTLSYVVTPQIGSNLPLFVQSSQKHKNSSDPVLDNYCAELSKIILV